MWAPTVNLASPGPAGLKQAGTFCDGKPSGIYPHPDDCSKFMQCNWGITYVMNCPAGLRFNPQFSVCDWPSNVNCQSGPAPPSPNRVTPPKPPSPPRNTAKPPSPARRPPSPKPQVPPSQSTYVGYYPTWGGDWANSGANHKLSKVTASTHMRCKSGHWETMA